MQPIGGWALLLLIGLQNSTNVEKTSETYLTQRLVCFKFIDTNLTNFLYLIFILPKKIKPWNEICRIETSKTTKLSVTKRLKY